MRAFDLTGQTFGRLTARRRCPGGYYLCACSCGQQVRVLVRSLTRGSTRSCGCLCREAAAARARARGRDFTGKTFGQWTVLRRTSKTTKRGTSTAWECRCSCGLVHVHPCEVVSGELSKSCRACAHRHAPKPPKPPKPAKVRVDRATARANRARQHAITHKRTRERVLAAGLCWRCPADNRKPVAPGRQLCAEHADRDGRRSADRNRALHDAGLCIDCPPKNRTPAVRSWRCDEHANAAAARLRAARARNAKRYDVLGELLTIHEMSEISGLSLNQLTARMNLQRMTPAEACLGGPGQRQMLALRTKAGGWAAQVGA